MNVDRTQCCWTTFIPNRIESNGFYHTGTTETSRKTARWYNSLFFLLLLPFPPLNIKFAMKQKPKWGKKGHETQIKLFNFHKMNSLVLIQSEWNGRNGNQCGQKRKRVWEIKKLPSIFTQFLTSHFVLSIVAIWIIFAVFWSNALVPFRSFHFAFSVCTRCRYEFYTFLSCKAILQFWIYAQFSPINFKSKRRWTMDHGPYGFILYFHYTCSLCTMYVMHFLKLLLSSQERILFKNAGTIIMKLSFIIQIMA